MDATPSSEFSHRIRNLTVIQANYLRLRLVCSKEHVVQLDSSVFTTLVWFFFFLLRVANTIRSFVCIIFISNKCINYLFSWISSLAVDVAVLLVFFFFFLFSFHFSPGSSVCLHEILILIKMKTYGNNAARTVEFTGIE